MTESKEENLLGKNLYVFRVAGEDEMTRHFYEEDLKEISMFFHSHLLKKMNEYLCDGCVRCNRGRTITDAIIAWHTFGTAFSEDDKRAFEKDRKIGEWCNVGFPEEEDLPRFLEMCNEKEISDGIDAVICKVIMTMEKLDVGYELIQKEEVIWEFDAECYESDFVSTKMIKLF